MSVEGVVTEVPSQFQSCAECEHFRYDHLGGIGYCEYGPFACECAEFEEPVGVAVERGEQ